MTKILHTADIHIQETGDERWQALESVLETAAQKQAEVLTISGDLFDKDFNAQEVRDKLRSLFSKQKFEIILLPGNHDSRSYQQGFYFGDNVTLINDFQKTYDIQDTTFTGIPFEPLDGSQLVKRIEAINQQLDEDQTNILLFHGELTDIFFNKEDFGDEGDKRYLPLKLNLLENTQFDYILAGHFHTSFTRQQLPNKRLKQGGFFVYPGSPVSITTKETGQRSAAFIETGKPPRQELLPTYHYQNVNVDLNPQTEQGFLTDLEKKLKQLDANAVGILTVNGYFDSQKLGLTETQLRQELAHLVEKHQCRLKDKYYHVKEVGEVLNSGLYQTFVERLQKTEGDTQTKNKLQKTLIQAMTRANA